MGILTLDEGRINQKLRTRTVLIEVASEILLAGDILTMEKVAQKAKVSKATVYRYFSKVDSLQLESMLHMKTKQPDTLFKDLTNDIGIRERVQLVIDYSYELNFDNENEFRLFLSAQLQLSVGNNKEYLRGKRRIPLISLALQPLRPKVSADEFNHMVYLISSLLGIESVVAFKDVCLMNNLQIKEMWEWTIWRILAPYLD